MAPRSVACAICSAPFITRHSRGKYCSPECQRHGERKSWRKYGARNRDQRNSYHRAQYRENVEEVTARIAAYRKTEAGKRATKVAGENQRKKFPEKYLARQAIAVALRTGRLKKKPCAHCGAGKAQAHHHDYSKPLDVEWLCAKCHRKEHVKEAA